MNNGGDVLARGCPSAQFAGASSGITSFENDFMYMTMEEVMVKYDLTQEAYDKYAAIRLDGTKLPDLDTTAEQERMDVGFVITDRRQNYLSNDVKAVAKVALKFPAPKYAPVETLMDRLLVMVISDDPNIELLEDGSARDLTTGLISTAKYRQHSNVGIVLLAGQWVVVSGTKTSMTEILKPGDKVIYGDYGSEKLPMSVEKAQALCDSLGVNYEKTEQGMRVIRVQDVRTVEHKLIEENSAEHDAFVANYARVGGTSHPDTKIIADFTSTAEEFYKITPTKPIQEEADNG